MKDGKNRLSIKTVYAVAIVLFVIMGIAGFSLIFLLRAEIKDINTHQSNYTQAVNCAEKIRRGSDELTEDIETYVVTGNTDYLLGYWYSINVAKTRDSAIEGMKELGITDEENALIAHAMSLSEELTVSEIKAMHYVLAAEGYTDAESVSGLVGDGFDDAARTAIFSSELLGEEDSYAYRVQAYELIFGENYRSVKEEINSDIDEFNSQVRDRMEVLLDESYSTAAALLGVNFAMIVLIMVCMAVVLAVLYTKIVKPLIGVKDSLAKGDSVEKVGGVAELSYITEYYNKKADDYNEHKERLVKESDMYRRKSEHDYLTDLVNRSVIDEYLNDKFVDPDNIPPFIVYMIDVDDFKKINDTYGHDAGDEVLKSIAAVFKSIAIKYNGLAARYGGEEFVLSVEKVTEDDVDPIAEEVLERVRALRIAVGTTIISVTVSMGSYFSLTGAKDAHTVLLNADGAMYKSKARGKNCHNRFKYMM